MTFYFFPNFIFSKCGKIIKACSYRSDFEYNNFLYALFNVKNQPLYLNFSIPLCEKYFFSQGSICPMKVKFCTHILDSPRNKNLKRLHSNLLEKMVFQAPKTLLSYFTTREKNFSSNFERYDLTNGEESIAKIWYTHTCTSQVLDPTVTFLIIHQKKKIFTLL